MAVFGFLLSALLYSSGISKAHAVINKTNHAATLFIDGYFTEINNTLTVLEENREVRNAPALDEDTRRDILDGYHSILKSNKNITYVYSGYDNGLLLINGYTPPPGYDPTGRPWYQAAMAVKPETSTGLPYRDIKSGEWLIATSRALKRSDGSYGGVVAIDCSLDKIVGLIAQHDEYKSEFTFVMDKAGKIIIHPDQAEIGRSISNENGAVLQTTKGDFTYHRGGRGYFAHSRSIPTTGWSVVTVVEKQEILRPIILQLALLIVLTGIIAVFLGMVQSTMLSRRLSRPLVELDKKIKASIEGINPDSSEYVYPDNEIGIMAKQIGQLAGKALNAKAVQLQASEETYKAILMASPDYITITDMSGRVIMLSDTAGRMFGYGPDEASRLTTMDFIVPEDHDRARMNMDRLLHEDYAGPNEYRAVRKDGSCFDIEVKSALIYDPQGDPVKIVLVARDITERKQAEEALRYSENFLMESQHIGRIGSFDLDIVNDRWSDTEMLDKIFGINASFPKSISGWLSLVHTDHQEQMKDYLKDVVIGAGQPFDREYPIVRKNDGEVRWVHGYGRLHFDDSGAPVRMVGTVQDITERRAMEAERITLEHQILNAQKLESLGVLAGGIAHDFNNLLTGILGNISFAKRFLEPDHRSSAILKDAEKAAERATGLTHQLLTFAKGSQPIKKVAAPRSLAESSANLVLSGSNVRCTISMPDDLHNVEVDEGLIGQAFNNIVLNAVQAMPDGGFLSITASDVTLDSGNAMALSAGDYVKFSFSDKGTGITEEDQKRIFDPYFTTKAGGSGLGLASVYSIISKHGGHISVKSLPGVGSTFEILLPASDGKIEPPPAQSMPADTGASRTCGAILVMDDEEMIRDLVTEMLTDLGYEVRTCPDGDNAVRLYREAVDSGHPYALVIMDLTIPGGMGGKEAARKILALDPAACLVVSSGYSTDPVMSDHTAFGFRAVMPKPYSLQVISNTLKSVLK